MQGELFDDENEWYQREQALALDRTTVHVRPWPNIGQPSMSIGLGGRRAIVGAVVGSAPLGVLGFFGEFGLDAVLVGGAPAVWATFGALVAQSGRAKWCRITQVLALLHYASGLALIAATAQGFSWIRMERALRQAPEVIVAWAAIYLIGQGVLWWRTSKGSQLQPTV